MATATTAATEPWPQNPRADDADFVRERTETNLRRVLALALVAVVIHLVNVAVFHRPADALDPGTLARWRHTLALSHVAMAGVGGLLAALVAWVMRSDRGTRQALGPALTLGAALGYSLFGAWLAAVDQMVTPSVTPFLIVSLVLALALQQGTGSATVLFLVLAAAGVELQLDSEASEAVRTSNAVNMVTISILAWILSQLMESSRRREFVQRATIEHQGAALAAATKGVMVTRRDGTITWVNPAFTRITGYAPEAVLGHTPRLLRRSSALPWRRRPIDGFPTTRALRA